MKQFEIESLAFRLMYRYGLYNWGWKFRFHRSKKISGLCNYKNKIISGSKFILIGSDETIIRNTLLHEIAHALVGQGNGHNEIWREKFIKIGGDGEIKSFYKKPTFIAKCEECTNTFHCHRRVNLVCKECYPNKFELLLWERVNYS